MQRAIEHIGGQSALGRWEFTVARPHPALRGYVREYVGGSEDTHQPLVRRELPTDIAPVIIGFGRPFRLIDQTDATKYVELRSFATGAFDTYALVGSTGAYSCIQINFTILGARLFLQQPLQPLANREVPLDALLGREASDLENELFEARSWANRFDILDRVVISRICASRPLPGAISCAWDQLVRHAGQVQIRRLAEDVGWSHKHFIAQFTEHIGIAPKAMARVMRFGRAAELLKVSERGRLAEIAHACGYYDQAHFTRDFRAFAGVTPTELLASQLPDGGGFSM
jgi:AraC-like DNA-binding protein